MPRESVSRDRVASFQREFVNRQCNTRREIANRIDQRTHGLTIPQISLSKVVRYKPLCANLHEDLVPCTSVRTTATTRERERRRSKSKKDILPQNRTTDAGDARRVRCHCTPARFLLARRRPAHLPYLARRCKWDPLENRLLIRDVRNGGDRTVGTRRGRRRPWRRRTRRLIARQGCRGAHGAVASVSSTWKQIYWIEIAFR